MSNNHHNLFEGASYKLSSSSGGITNKCIYIYIASGVWQGSYLILTNLLFKGAKGCDKMEPY